MTAYSDQMRAAVLFAVGRKMQLGKKKYRKINKGS